MNNEITEKITIIGLMHLKTAQCSWNHVNIQIEGKSMHLKTAPTSWDKTAPQDSAIKLGPCCHSDVGKKLTEAVDHLPETYLCHGEIGGYFAGIMGNQTRSLTWLAW